MASTTEVVHGVVVMGRDGRLTYQLRLPQFEGPLDVLLHLIERRELEITAISLAAVADQFLAHVRALAEADPATLADFVAVGARLVLIKSQALLPRPAQPTGGSEEEIDDVEALARQLAEYRQARATALVLAERQAAGARAHERPVAVQPSRCEPPPLAPLSLADLTRAVRRRLLELPAEPVPVPSARVVSLADKVAEIETMLARDGQVSLSLLLAHASNRLEVIVTFIGLLELIRRRRIAVRQPVLFGEIDITPWRDEPSSDVGGGDG